MEIGSKANYYNSIYEAIIVNTEYDQDPDSRYRVQIYIPSLHQRYQNIYTDYMNSSDKPNHKDKSKYPWAVSLVDDLQEGNVVYGSYIGNTIDDHIVLGLYANHPANAKKDNSGLNIDTSNLIELCMPIILQNEVGISPNAWPDGISNDNYGRINPNDAGKGWSIGLLQWNGPKAYDCCLAVSKNDSGWKSHWMFNKGEQLYRDLESGSESARSNYGANFVPSTGTSKYNSIKGMLTSDKGKEAQRNKAKTDVGGYVSTLQQNGITNPAIIIFLADMLNQYGDYALPETRRKAATVCNSNKDIMGQLDDVIDICKKNIGDYFTHTARRDRTIAYIKQLDSQGKLNLSNPADISGEGNAVVGNGQYCIPFKGTWGITAQWGKSGYANGYTGYSSGAGHSGIDFGCPTGTPLVACTSGTINQVILTNSYGTHIRMVADDGNTIYYAHMSRFASGGNGTSRHVQKGEVIGYSGNTGHSQGAHLHFEIRPKSGGDNSAAMYGSANPAPYLGIDGHTGTRVSGA